MKNFFTLLFLFLFSQQYVNAQKGLSLQFITLPGASFGDAYQVPVDLNTYPNYKFTSMGKAFTFGIEAGADLSYFFDDKMGIGLDVLYTKQGQNYNDYAWELSNLPVTVHREVSLNYFKIPIRFNYVYSPELKTSFILSAGFYMGFLTSYKDELSLTESNIFSVSYIASGNALNYSSSFHDRYNGQDIHEEGTAAFQSKPFYSTDFGATVAIGFQFKLSEKITLPVMLNYEIGFSDIINEGSIVNDFNSSRTNLYWKDFTFGAPITYHNSFFGLMTGLKINLGSKKESN